MNKRIKELAEQAYEQQPFMIVNPQTYELEHKIGNGGVPMYHRVFNQEKFAELIVKKFDDILLLQQLDCIGNHDKKSTKLIEKLRDNTQTYFGVEE